MSFKKGFTLIELLVVIAIIGILSGVIVVSMNGATNAAKDAIRKNDISSMRKALLSYQILNGSYPTATCDDINDCATLSTALIPNYLGTLPTDPDSSSSYSYTSADGTDFTVAATLSDTTGYSYTASTGFGTTGGGSGSSYVSTCESGGGLTCTETIVGEYTYYKYTGTGTTDWVVPSTVTSVDVFLVGGGGSGGEYGGGGGGYTTNQLNISVSTGNTWSVVVGSGGTYGYDGNSSSFVLGGTSYSAAGEKKGNADRSGGNGGSGGGGGSNGYGICGGNGGNNGSNGTPAGSGILPGTGQGTTTLAFATAEFDGVYYSGGGGGMSSVCNAGTGGNYGGGVGAGGNNGYVGQPGLPNSGGGGGGYCSCAGGSGLVVIRFTTP